MNTNINDNRQMRVVSRRDAHVPDPSDATWLAEVRAEQDDDSVRLEHQLRAWLSDGTLPTLALWHGRNATDYGDCEVTALALYKDLRRAGLDEAWTLVCGAFPIGRHLWCIHRADRGEAQAVNLNLGRVMVVPLSKYVAANKLVSALYPMDHKFVGRLYAAMTRVTSGVVEDVVALERLYARAFRMEARL